MVYQITSPNQVAYLTASWIPSVTLINLCNRGLGQLFQAQAARDVTREQFSNCLGVLVTEDTRFPETGFFVYLNDPVIKPIYEALMKSFDTKNRIIEVEEESRPGNGEIQSATRRVDDATVAIRSEIQNMLNVLVNGGAFYNRTSFERIFTWTEASSSGN
ncbi:CP [Hoya chlorotic spot virus]|uniref:CP n=1 Tax=Hoya chlorotic spot virus TaxID=1979541 RepID=UPI000A16C444|nr:CP [Hoya chlorotic spot virus]ARI47181.1 CP [Hoya chlorotic spot virus]